MKNSLYRDLNPQPRNNQSLFQGNNNTRQLINNFKNSQNPKQFLLNYIQNNPQAKNIYNLLRNGNKSPKDLFYFLAEQRGINPEDILKMLNS